jgi:hypothetical protein
MTDEEHEKAPDFRVFGVEITDEMKEKILDKFANVTRCVAEGVKPALDLESFRFNNFKRSCAESLDTEELAEIQSQVERMQRSSLPDWKKRGYVEALEFIENVRGEAI